MKRLKRKKDKDEFNFDPKTINQVYLELFKHNFDVNISPLDLSNLKLNNSYNHPIIVSTMYRNILSIVDSEEYKLDARYEKTRVKHTLTLIESGTTKILPHIYNMFYLIIALITPLLTALFTFVGELENNYFKVISIIMLCVYIALLPSIFTKSYANTHNKESFEDSFKHLFYSTYLEILNQKFY